MRRTVRGMLRLVVISAALAAPGRAAAQAVFLEAGGGVSVPLIETGRTLDLGPHGVLGLALISRSVPLGLEFSARYGHISGASTDGGTAADLRVLDLSADVIYRLKWSLNAPVRPWVMAGAGLYDLQQTGDAAPPGAESVSNAGLVGGAGIAVPLSSVVELWTDARFHVVFAGDVDDHFFTASVGARVPLHR